VDNEMTGTRLSSGRMSELL